MRVLEADERVISVTLAGSLNGGKSDEFSDIDLSVELRRGIEDRAFFFDVPRLLEPLGESVSGWGFNCLPHTYVATFNFADYPLFWKVDVECRSDAHVDGSDLLTQYRWEQIYKMWMDAAKQAARAQVKLEGVRTLLAKHVDVDEAPSTSAEQLRALLNAIRERKIAKGDPYEDLHRRCEELAAAFD